MNLKEHLQFLILMIPTLLLLIAAVLILAAPATSATLETSAAMNASDPFEHREVVALDTEIGPLRTVAAR